MNKQEQDIILLLENLYEKFIELNEQHPDDKKEFINALHVIQHLIMIRSVRRKYPELFPIINDDKNITVKGLDEIKDLIEVNVKKELS